MGRKDEACSEDGAGAPIRRGGLVRLRMGWRDVAGVVAAGSMCLAPMPGWEAESALEAVGNHSRVLNMAEA